MLHSVWHEVWACSGVDVSAHEKWRHNWQFERRNKQNILFESTERTSNTRWTRYNFVFQITAKTINVSWWRSWFSRCIPHECTMANAWSSVNLWWRIFDIICKMFNWSVWATTINCQLDPYEYYYSHRPPTLARFPSDILQKFLVKLFYGTPHNRRSIVSLDKSIMLHRKLRANWCKCCATDKWN